MRDNAEKWLKKYNLIIFEDIDNTNEEAKRLIKAGVSGNFIIWAISQANIENNSTNNTELFSNKLNLSILLFDEENILSRKHISFLLSVSIGEIFENLNQYNDIYYKWPNEIIIENQNILKTSLETFYNYLIIGLEINLLELQMNTAIDNVMKNFHYWLGVLKKTGFDPIKKAWLSKRNNINEVITIIFGNNRISGVFKDIDDSGSIKVILAGGQEYRINAGKIFNYIGNKKNGNE